MKKNYLNFGDKICIVAHDAGAANLILGWIKNNQSYKYCFNLSGPAIKIFQENNFINGSCNSEEIPKNCKAIISGTSLKSMHEHNARWIAKKLNILCIAVLDHWVNYEIRFIRKEIKILPDIIWVFDQNAENIAKNLFKTVIIQKQKNYYIDGLVKKINNFKIAKDFNQTRILYVLEPIRKETDLKEYLYEFKVLDFFLEKIPKLNLRNQLKIKLRLHPSEKKFKYQKWLKNKNLNYISLSYERPLFEDISWADIVVGYESYALVVANASSKKCFSSKLPNEDNCRLMIGKLEYLRDLI